MTWQTFLFLPLAIGAFGFAGYKIFTLVKLMKAMKGKGPEVDDLGGRIKNVLLYVFGQKAVLQKPGIGIAHAFIFWGFLIVSVGTTEQFLSTLWDGANFEFIGEGPYRALVFLQDVFTLLVLVGVTYALYRRVLVRPSYLGPSSDAMFVLLLTGSLMVSIFFMNAFHIVGAAPSYADAMPISSHIASHFSWLDTETGNNLSIVFKWIHMLIVLGFSVYIPSSKHLHVLAAGPNTFLKKGRREKGMVSIPFEDESITQYGAGKVTDLSWKDTLDYFSCTECGRCQEVCPAWNTDKPLSPKKLISDLKYNLYRNKTAVLAADYDSVTPVIDDQVTQDVIWACTSCRACEIACPVFIEHTDKIYEIRRNLVMMESQFPAEVQPVFKNMETNGTPWAFASSDRANWAEGLDVPVLANAPEFDVLLWVGCAGSFDDRNKKVLRSFVNLLKRANVRFAMLGNEEQCTGDAARRIGNEYLFQTLAQVNVENLNRYNVKRIVTACPHCFNTIKNEYTAFGGQYEVFHHSEYLAKLIAEGKLQPKAESGTKEKVAFHDSCYLGRWNNVYSSPRAVVQAAPGVELVEISANHEKSMCCGAGGGRMWMEEHIGKRINITRTEQALETGATTIAVACPFCMTMISDGVKMKEKSDQVRVVDISELL